MTGNIDGPASNPLMRVMRHWDAREFETDDVTPPGSSSAVILWEGFPDVDGGVPDRLVRPLATALVKLGEVCFRVEDRLPADGRVLATVETARGPFARSWKIIGSRDGDAAMVLFDVGWAQGDQVAVIAPLDDKRAAAMLAAKRLSEIELKGSELVAAAIVDGAGMLLAASDQASLEAALDLVLKQCADEGIAQQRD